MPGRFLKNDLGTFGPPGRYEKTRKNTHLSHAHSNSKAAAGVDHVATQQHRQGTQYRQFTHHRQKINQTLGKACVVLVKRRPRGKARRPQFPHLLQRGPVPRVHPPTFELERSVGPNGRHSYPTVAKLRVIDYTRLRYSDSGLVGNRGAATGLEQGLCPRLTLSISLSLLKT